MTLTKTICISGVDVLGDRLVGPGVDDNVLETGRDWFRVDCSHSYENSEKTRPTQNTWRANR